MTSFGCKFPAVRGVQSGREYFSTMCPLRLLTLLFPDTGDEEIPNLGTRGLLDRQRVEEIARYVISGRDSYVLSAITASVDCPVSFVPDTQTDAPATAGQLLIPMSARLTLHDGRHRLAGLTAALQ